MPRATELDQRLILGLSLAQLVTWGSTFYTFALLVDPVESALKLERAQTSLAFSLALLVEGLCAFWVGRWIDRGYERAVMAGGSLVVALGLLLHSQAQGLALFYAAWGLIGAGMSATLYTPVFAVVTRRFPESFRRGIIVMTFLGGLASTVFIPLGAWLIGALGWRTALVCLALLQLLVCLPLHLRLLRHAPPGRPDAPPGATVPPGAELGRYLRSAPFLLIAAFIILVMAATAALPPHMVSLLRGRGLPEAWVILVPASLGAIQVLGRAVLFVFESRFDVHLSNRLIPALLPAGLGLLLAAPWAGAAGPLLVLGFVVLYGLGNGLVTIVKGTAIAQYVSRDHVASLNGSMGLPLALARAAAPWLMGVSWSPADGYRTGLWLLLAMCVTACLALLWAQRLARGHHQRTPR